MRRPSSAWYPLLFVAALTLPLAIFWPATQAPSPTLRLMLGLVGAACLLAATHLCQRQDTRAVRFAWAAALGLFVLHSYVQAYHPVYGWTALIQFGGYYDPVVVPELQAMPRYVLPGGMDSVGYDGQFYAQVALDPLLRGKADLDAALENPCYRARRILLPALSYVLGLGKPRWVIHAYPLVHFGAFLALVVLLVRSRLLAPFGVRAALSLTAISLGAGVVSCLLACVPDLAAAVLIVAAIALSRRSGTAAIALSGLVRDTGLLGLVVLLPTELSVGKLKRAVWTVVITVAPAAAWYFYATNRLVCEYPFGIGNIGLPLVAMSERMVTAVHDINVHQLRWGNLTHFFLYDEFARELCTICCIAIQMGYLLTRVRQWRGQTRTALLVRLGLVFTMLGMCLGEVPWEGTSAVARVLIPLTIAFNLLLLNTRSRVFWPLFLAGNLYSIPRVVELYLLAPPG